MYSDTEKKTAKRLKKLAFEETGRKWPHQRCLRLVHEYNPQRDGRKTEEYVAMIFETENQAPTTDDGQTDAAEEESE